MEMTMLERRILSIVCMVFEFWRVKAEATRDILELSQLFMKLTRLSCDQDAVEMLGFPFLQNAPYLLTGFADGSSMKIKIVESNCASA